jgi:hypothetical protein
MKKQIYIIITDNLYRDASVTEASKIIPLGLDIVKVTTDKQEAERAFEATCKKVRNYFGECDEDSMATRYHEFVRKDESCNRCVVSTWIKDLN